MSEKINNNTPNMLIEWELPWKEDGFIKLYVDEVDKKLCLNLLTTTLPVYPLEVNLCLNQLAKLNFIQAWEFYRKLINEDIAQKQKREKELIWLIRNPPTAI